MGNKGREFKGLAGGRHYRRMAALFGMGPGFYRKGIGNIKLGEGMKALDLGCGPGSLCFALAERAQKGSKITGIDISADQLSYARRYASGYPCELEFRRISMDSLPFPAEHFNIVMTSMAIHATPPKVRRAAVKETARVLKRGGVFLLVDWSMPCLGLWGIVWFPLVCWGKNNMDNWENVYPELCSDQGLIRKEDSYINSIARRQVFSKKY